MTRISQRGKPTYIYFAEDPISGLVKIGYTSNPNKRLRELRRDVSNPSIKMLATARGNRQTELGLHALFRGYRAQGEWFKRSPALEALIGFVRSFPSTRADLPSTVLDAVA